MKNFTGKPIGEILCTDGGMRIALDRAYAPALTGLEGFSHLQVLWWFSEFDTEAARSVLTMPAPYRRAPETLGTFATRSPMRPNPIALDCVELTGIDRENAILHIAFIDAYDHSPVLDIKPYTPSLDRVERPEVPAWCRHWPKRYEDSGDFDWAGEMNA